jgi:acetyltransferase-like isoleucine patch superfamily enzyme
MPNKSVGRVLRIWQSLLDRCNQAASDSINFAQLGLLEQPFDIHYSVEFRAAHQIQIRTSCCIKARAIINGRSAAREHGVSFGPDTYLKEHCYFDAYGGFIDIEGQSAFGQGTIIHGGGGVTIGANVITGAYCQVIASNHRFDSREYPTMLQGDRRKGISIGRNVWLGGHVVVVDGVKIGDNCVIGAGTVVTKDVSANTLVVDKRQKQETRIFCR